jgi:hypothetical protein
MEELELTNEMNERNDEIDNETYDYILMLTEKTEEELEWDIDKILSVVDAVKDVLWRRWKLKVRHPGVVTNDDGTQFIAEYDYD